MNILLQSAGVCVMIVIFIFYFYDRKAAVKQNRLFLYQSFAVFISLVLDITSIVFINTPSMTYSFITYALCKLYLVSCLVIVYLALIYVLSDLPEKIKFRIDFTKYTSFVILIVFSILALVLPLNIVYDPKGLNDYTEGVPVILTYACTFFFMAIILTICFRNRHNMYIKRFYAVVIFISIWIFGASVQGIVNYMFSNLGVVILSVSFTETLGCLAIYIMLESPSFNIDRVTGALNQRALEDYLKTCYKRCINIEFFIIEYDNVYASQIMGHNEFARAVSKTLSEFKVNKVFKNDRNEFVVIRHKNRKNEIEDLAKWFKETLYKKYNIVTEIPYKVIYFGDISLFNDSVDCLNVVDYMINTSSKYQEQIIYVTKEISDEIHKKFDMQKKCDIAFSKRNIDVYLQPIYSLKLHKFSAAEALVRLKDDNGEIIKPGDFIEDMEYDGRIIELGKIVFDNVCEFISNNDLEKLGLHYIEVNLSAAQCLQPNLAIEYINIMEKYRINPKYINLEITETAQSNRTILLDNMKKLREYGISFSLDDFGTGNSNLNYVIEMPVNIVKFDKSMVDMYFDNKIASYVMNAAIDMIKGLGHEIVFEGIEKEIEVDQVKALEVDYIQGFYFSKAIPQNEFVEFVKKNKVGLDI